LAKPNPHILKYAKKKSNSTPTIYIGNSIEHDIVCANRYGIKSILKTNTNKTYSRNIEPDYSIQQLIELKNIPEIPFKN